MLFCFNIIFLLFLAITSRSVIAQTCHPIPHEEDDTIRFAAQNNGTIKDNKTGLVWKQCSEGLSGVGCEVGNPTSYNWQDTIEHAKKVNVSGFAGFKDWRVPNDQELRSIVERHCYSPSINISFFPNTEASYWTSSSIVNRENFAWSIHFDYGYPDWDFKQGKNYLRLVRAGK